MPHTLRVSASFLCLSFLGCGRRGGRSPCRTRLQPCRRNPHPPTIVAELDPNVCAERVFAPARPLYPSAFQP